MSTQDPAPEPGEDSDIDQAEAERQLATGGDVRRRRRLYDLIRDTLPADTRNYALAPILDERIEAVLEGHGITSSGGDPGIVAEFLFSLHRLVATLDGEMIMRALDFTSSVRVELEPKVPEPVRRIIRERVERDPQGFIQHDDLRELIPTSVVAANAMARLLKAPSQDALREARRYGSDVPEAYLRLARSVEKTGGEMEVRAPGRRTATLTARRAERVIARLSEPKPELDPVPITVVGHLTRTDSDEKVFRLVLDRELIPDVLDKRKRHIDGGYTTTASRQVREEGLWDRRVIAKVRAYPVVDPLTGGRRFERFSFRSLRLAA